MGTTEASVDQQIKGEIPTYPIVMAACDSKYFIDHAAAFVASLDKVNKHVHLHVVNPTDEVFSKVKEYNEKTNVNVTMSYNNYPIDKLQGDAVRTYYACLRFFVAPAILQYCKKLMILDIDCVVMQDFQLPEQPIGYFPRAPFTGSSEWQKEGTRVAAGVVYFDERAINVVQEISTTISKLPLQWFVDQVALSQVLMKVDPKHTHHYNGNFMDWEFKPGTTVWTGKGHRKYSNKKYVAQKKEFAQCLA